MKLSRSANPYFLAALGRELCALLWTRKKLAALLFTLMLGAGISVLWRITPRYEAALKILVTRAADQQASANSSQVSTAELQSEVEILKSHEVVAATSQELALPTANVARLSVRTLDQSNIIQVTYSDMSPAQAARFLQTLFQQYSAYRQTLQPRVTAGTTLRERSAAFNQKLDETTNAIKQIDTQHNLMSFTEQQNLLLRQLYDTRTQAEAARTEKQATEQQITTLRAQLATQPEQIEIGSVTKYGQALDKLKEELLALELQRTQLLQKYQANHRLIRDLEQRVAQAKELITREEQNPPRERSIALNETRRRIANDLFQAETNFVALRQREQRLRQLAQEYQARLDEMNVQGFKKGDLERERRLNEEAYLLYQKKAQEADINASLNQTVQVSLVEAATINPNPISPHWPRNLSGLLVLGLFTSIGGVVIAESLRPRIRTEEGIRRRFGLNVLAKLPAASQTKLEI